MRINLPVTQNNYDFPGNELLVSITNPKGEITHCNAAFTSVSGYTYEELIGQPHNLIRHPDMPAAAFKDLWRTIAHGYPWTALVKNRRKNGDHYWVRANVTPIMEGGKPKGYLSVRTKPAAAEIQAAEALYARMRTEAETGQESFRLRSGEIRHKGLRGWWDSRKDVGMVVRMELMLAVLALLLMLPDMLGWQGAPAWGTRLAVLLAGGAWITWRFYDRCVRGLEQASRFAADIASCNLSTDCQHTYGGDMGALMQRLLQIQINLRAVVGDVRSEVKGFAVTAQEIAHGSQDLAARTESQSSNLQETAASMEEISGTVAQTADMAQVMERESEASKDVARHSGSAIEEVGSAMEHIRGSSTRMREIIGVIESIAFQTNLLALNAAVEAARAGEQGRGFAVVAGEVRALAQRSAEAAKEISVLINRTVDGINDGNARMDAAGQTISGMVDAVERVSEMVHQISIATREQSLGIAQVNEAVAHLDSVTQQNAALVEESTSAAHSLRHSAQTLERSVDVFTMR
ncbi:MAG: methyl-accepting chemotaxis protein [Acidovorax sp.]|jgi:aerotaxis receptor|nr:methyl-accepting chemotaxis protein [Acidovorax sp.]